MQSPPKAHPHLPSLGDGEMGMRASQYYASYLILIPNYYPLTRLNI
jgi:hypothetical protein